MLKIISQLRSLIFAPVYRAYVSAVVRARVSQRYEEKEVNFLHYTLRIPDMLTFSWQAKDIFVQEAYKFYSERPEPVIYDCGANIGLSCLFFKKNYPSARIYAFEADPKIAQVLKENLSKNGAGDVEVIEKAVWVHGNGVKFGVEGSDSGSIIRSEHTVNVPSVDLYSLLRSEDHIDMLKIDIEGAEVDVLEHCVDALWKVKNLFVEYHSFVNRPQQLSRILRILEQANFRFYIEQPEGRRHPLLQQPPNQGMDLVVNIFARNEGTS